MTPPARYAAAIDILDAILAGQPTEKALLAWSRRSRFAGSKDRAAVRDIVFQAMRRQRSCASMGGAAQPITGRGIIRGLLAQGGIDETTIFGNGTHAPPQADDPDLVPYGGLPLTTRLDLQDWVWDMWHSDHSDAADIATALRDRAPLWLRVNTTRADPAQVAATLREDGHTVSQHPHIPAALQVAYPAKGLAAHRLVQSGHIEFQDLSSQRAIDEIPDVEGAKVLDFCAGGGGKSLALAARGGQVTAHDASTARMRDIPQRAKRAGAKITIAAPQELQEGAFDIVVVDAPCSGSGAWRRAVDTKWTLTPDDLHSLVALQRQILTQAAQYLRPGGVLAYMTCSLFRVENVDQVRWIEDRFDLSRQHAHQMTPLDGGDGFYCATFTCNTLRRL